MAAEETTHRHQVPARPPRRLVDHRRRARERRLRMLRDGARAWRPARRPGPGEGVGPARPRRRQLRHRAEVVVPAEGPVPALPRRERRRGRALDVQGPHAGRARSAPAHRGRHHHGVRDPVPPRVHLPPRRVRARRTTGSAQALADAYERRASSARTSSAPASTSRSSLHRGAGATSPATRPACSRVLEGERGMPRIKPPFPAVAGRVRRSPRS